MITVTKGVGVDLSAVTTQDSKGESKVHGLGSRSLYQEIERLASCIGEFYNFWWISRASRACGGAENINAAGCIDGSAVGGKHQQNATLRTAHGTIALGCEHTDGRDTSEKVAQFFAGALNQAREAGRRWLGAGMTCIGGVTGLTEEDVEAIDITIVSSMSSDSCSTETSAITKHIALMKQGLVVEAELEKIEEEVADKEGPLTMEAREEHADGTCVVHTQEFTLPPLPDPEHPLGPAACAEIERARKDVIAAVQSWRASKRTADYTRYKESIAYLNCLLHACIHALTAGSDAVEEYLKSILPDGFLEEQYKLLSGSSPGSTKDGVCHRSNVARAPAARSWSHARQRAHPRARLPSPHLRAATPRQAEERSRRHVAHGTPAQPSHARRGQAVHHGLHEGLEST